MPLVYLIDQPGTTLNPQYIASSPLKDEEVRVKITHCGLCQSDLGFMQNAYGDSRYPMVPGHEVVGIITECGRLVPANRLGERVGVSWQLGACGHCHPCLDEHEELCPDLEAVALGRFGGFAEEMIANAHFVYTLPESLESAHAAPLMCAGSTMFNAIQLSQVSPGMSVGIVGIGGLGHLGILFLKAMGCEITAFSHSSYKAADAHALGASYFVNSLDHNAILNTHCDVILSTVSAPLHYDAYIKSLRPQGKFCFVGIPNHPVTIDIFPLLIGQKSVLASPLGSIKTNQDMLEFSAKHDIKPWITLMPMTQLPTALELLAQHKTRYRIVLTVP